MAMTRHEALTHLAGAFLTGFLLALAFAGGA